MKKHKRLTSIMLTFCMVLTMLPFTGTSVSAENFYKYCNYEVAVGEVAWCDKVLSGDELITQKDMFEGKDASNPIKVTFDKPGKVELQYAWYTQSSVIGIQYTKKNIYKCTYTVYPYRLSDISFKTQSVPKKGEKISSVVVSAIGDNGNFEIVPKNGKKAVWYEAKGNSSSYTEATTDTFREGYQYCVKIYFKTKQDTVFLEKSVVDYAYVQNPAQVYINDHKVIAYHVSGREYYVSLDYPLIKTTANGVFEFQVDEPDAGSKPAPAESGNTEGIEWTSAWYDEYNMPFSGTFIPNDIYNIRIYVKPAEDYIFDANMVDMIINGREVYFTKNNTGEYTDYPYYVEYGWVCTYDKDVYKPQIKYAGGNNLIEEGKDLCLAVIADNPEPNTYCVYSWSASRDGESLSWTEIEKICGSKIKTDSSTLEIKNVNFELSGIEFECCAVNNLGAAFTDPIPLIVVEDVTTVKNIEITGLDAPTHGKAADYTASAAASNCRVTDIQYKMFNKSLDPYMPKKGDQIAVCVTVQAAAGYNLAENCPAVWNGVEAYSSSAGASENERIYVFTHTVGATDDVIIRNLDIVVEAPSVGKTPAVSASVPEGTRLESIEWSPSPAGGVFSEGESYTVKAYIWPEDTHLMADDILTAGSCSVNGQQASMSKPDTGSSGAKQKFSTGIYVSYTFPELKAGAPLITSHPESVTVQAGESAVFEVTAEGDGLHYQWWAVDAGVPVKVGTDSSKLVLENVTVSQHNNYDFYCTVSNDVGEETSVKAHLTVEGVSEFTDVPKTAWYYESVKAASRMGLINGKTPLLYAPSDNMSYAEAVKLTACMHQLYTEGAVTLSNGSSVWYSTYYEYCRDKGIIPASSTSEEPGFSELMANAGKKVTRAQYALLFSRALPDEAMPVINIIPDGSIPDVESDGSIYNQAVYKLYRTGIVNGTDSNGTFKPDSNIKRSEVAAILIRMMDADVRVGEPAGFSV